MGKHGKTPICYTKVMSAAALTSRQIAVLTVVVES